MLSLKCRTDVDFYSDEMKWRTNIDSGMKKNFKGGSERIQCFVFIFRSELRNKYCNACKEPVFWG